MKILKSFFNPYTKQIKKNNKCAHDEFAKSLEPQS